MLACVCVCVILCGFKCVEGGGVGRFGGSEGREAGGLHVCSSECIIKT